MPTYERVQGGRVVERVQPLAGDYEDTRLGLLAIEGEQGWRVATAEQPTPEQAAEQQPPAPPAERKPSKSKE